MNSKDPLVNGGIRNDDDEPEEAPTETVVETEPIVIYVRSINDIEVSVPDGMLPGIIAGAAWTLERMAGIMLTDIVMQQRAEAARQAQLGITDASGQPIGINRAMRRHPERRH